MFCWICYCETSEKRCTTVWFLGKHGYSMIKKSLSQTTISWRPSVKVSKTCIWFSIPLVKTYSLPKKFILSTLLLNQLLDTILCCHYFQYLAVNEWRGGLIGRCRALMNNHIEHTSYQSILLLKFLLPFCELPCLYSQFSCGSYVFLPSNHGNIKTYWACYLLNHFI